MSEPRAGDRPTPRARIEVLGPFRVFDADGELASVPRGKNTALLARLAAESHGVDREALEAAFWPDSTPRARRQSLRQAFSTLRKALGCDPFVVGERVRLDPECCGSDFEEFRDALWRNDEDRCLSLFRGAPFTDVPSNVSVAFEHWLDRRREAALQRLGAVAQSMGRRALDEDDEVEVKRVMRLGSRGGLEEGALRAAIYGTRHDRPSWAAATLGPDGLETLAFRARPGLDSLIALVVEDDHGWAAETLADRIAALPAEGRPTLVRIPEQTNDAETEIAGLLRTLVGLPGGAAVRQSTLDAIDHLASTADALADDRTRASVEAALADALDAALDEQALVLTCPAAGIRLLPASVLARALALQGGEGATLVVHGASERELRAPPVRTLVDACRELRHVRQSVAGSLGPPVDVTPGTRATAAEHEAHDRDPGTPASDHEVEAPTPGGNGARPPVVGPPADGATDPALEPAVPDVRTMVKEEIWTRARHIGYLTVAAFALGAAGLKFVTSAPPSPPARPLTDYDVLFCSERAGPLHYYRWSAATGVVERVTADTVPRYEWPGVGPGCIGLGTATPAGDSLWLPVSVGGQPDEGGALQWRKYPNVPSRGDLTGRVVFDDLEPGYFGPPFEMGEARVAAYVEDRPRWVLHLVTGERTPVPEGVTMITGWSGPWAVGTWSSADGSPRHVRVHLETGEVEQLTPGLSTEGMGPLRGDSLLFVRGRQAQDEDGSLELILRHVDTGEEELLTDNDWNDYEMKWSPDGRHICWQSEEFGHYQSEILVMDLRTRRTWNLSASEGRDFGCSFTPDGRAVVYQSLRTGNVDLIIQPVAGGPAVNMTFYPGDDVLVGFVGRQGG